MRKLVYFGITVLAFAVAALTVEVVPALSAVMIAVMAWAVRKGELWDSGEKQTL